MTGLKNSFKRKTWFLLPLCLLLGVLLLWGYSNLFTRANFPYTQPGTYWTDEDGILSVQVSDKPVQSSSVFRPYRYQAYVCWNGTQYAAAFGINPRAPLHLSLQDSDGLTVKDFAWSYHMSNRHELQLTFAAGDHTDESQLIGGKTKLILRRVS